MGRLIDADELMKLAETDGSYGYVSTHEIANAPTVDAVEVIRCGKCKYFHKNNENDPYCNAKDGLSDPTENTFCSYGERRSDEVN